jgi:hypothetical protein
MSMHTYIQIIHICISVNEWACIHTYIQICISVNEWACIHTYIQICVSVNEWACISSRYVEQISLSVCLCHAKCLIAHRCFNQTFSVKAGKWPCVYTYTLPYIHTRLPPHTHSKVNTYIHTNANTHILLQTHKTPTNTNANTHIRTQTHTYKHKRKNMHTNAQIRGADHRR